MLKKLQLKLTVAFSFLCSIILIIIIGFSLVTSIKSLSVQNQYSYSDASYQIYSYLFFALDTNNSQNEISSSLKIEKPFFLLHQEADPFFSENNSNQIENNWDVGVDTAKIADTMFESSTISSFTDEEIVELYFSGELYNYMFPAAILVEDTEGAVTTGSVWVSNETITDGGEASDAQSVQPSTPSDYDNPTNDFGYAILQFPEQNTEIEGINYRYSTFLLLYQDSQSGSIKIARYLFVEDMSFYAQQQFFIVLNHLLIFGGCLLVLIFISHFAAKVILRSTGESMQQQADFVAAASHEFQNPITIIKNSLVLLESAEKPEKKIKYLKIAQNEALQLENLTRDLLILAGSSSGKWKITNRSVDLDTVLIDTHEKFQTLSKEKKITIKLLLPEETLPSVNGDEVRFKQILDILLNNALQYSPENSSIEIEAKRKSSAIEISIIDHGVGIKLEDKEKVFNKFYRADKSRQDKEHYGLGLSVANELALLHKGSLHLSETNGGGATFTLEFPVKNKKSSTTSPL